MLRIAVVQFTPRRGDLAGNVAAIGEILTGVEADLCVLPELCSTGYLFTHREELLPLSESAGEGALGTMLRDFTRRSSTAVIAGYAERDDEGKLYNAALALTPDGRMINYRKAHLFYREAEVFEPGDTPFPVFDLGGVGIGIMICYDWRFPEVARTLRLRGAGIIAHPSNLVAPRKLWVPTNSVRAFENRVFIATANRGGEESADGEHLAFSGGSSIFDVNGEILSSLDMEDGVIVADIDPDRAMQTSFNGINDILLDRRPDLYDL